MPSMVFYPFTGEFGSKLAKHVFGINWFCSQYEAIICHEEGEEIIYPNATERWTYPRPDENDRKASLHLLQQKIHKDVYDHFGRHYKYIDERLPMKYKQLRFVPQETKDYGKAYNLDFDLLLFPRKKEYAHGRNWPFWVELHDGLKANGVRCLVAGHKDSCYHLDCPSVWDYVDTDKVLDMTVWAIKAAPLMVGTATGTTFLALMCQRPPILIVGDNAMDALGSKQGLKTGDYFRMDESMVGWKAITHWSNWHRVLEELMAALEDPVEFKVLLHKNIFGYDKRNLAAQRKKDLAEKHQ